MADLIFDVVIADDNVIDISQVEESYSIVEVPGERGPRGFQGEQGERGEKGDTGDPGVAASVEVGEVSTGEPGSSGSVTNSGSSSQAVLNFVVPRGAVGERGERGEVGPPGTTSWGGITDKPSVIAAGEDAAAARSAIGAKADDWVPSSTDISDATSTGRGVLTASDGAAARSAIGAGTSSLGLGSDSSTAKPGDWKPASTDITDASSVGRSVLTAGSASVARGAIGAEDVSARGAANGYASLDGAGKVPLSQLPAGIFEYQGTWDANTNTPALTDGTGRTGDLYRVSVGGVQDLGGGPIAFSVGDYAIYNPAGRWEKSDTTDAVSSVNGMQGDVTLGKTDVGLGSVDNTADSVKSVASAGKLTTARNINGVPFDGTADISVVDSSKEPAVSAGTTSQYYRGDKSWATLDKSAVGLGNVDNTSDASKNSAVAALTNKDLSSSTNTFPSSLVDTSSTQTLSGKTLSAPALTGAVSIASGGEIDLFSTADQTTNYQRLRAYYGSSAYRIVSENGGTGTAQPLSLSATNGSQSAGITLNPTGQVYGNIRLNSDASNGAIGVSLDGNITAGTSTQAAVRTAVNQSGAAGYTAFSVQVTETATGSGTKRLIDAQVGGTSKFTVDNTGVANAVGGLQANGVPVVTTTGSQTVTNKTISGLSNTLTNIPASATPDAARLVVTTVQGDGTTEGGTNTWAKLATISYTGEFGETQLLFSVAGSSSGSHDTAIVSVFFRVNNSGANPSAAISLIAKGGDGSHLSADSFKIVSGGWLTNAEIWMKKTGPLGRFNVYELTRRSLHTITWNDGATWQSAVPTGAVNNATTNGVTAFGVPVVTTSGTATLTNKTLTNPKIVSILGSNGNTTISTTDYASAVNFLQVQNGTTGNPIWFYGAGSDTNVPMFFATKGTGEIRFGSGSGAALRIISPSGTVANFIGLKPQLTGTDPIITSEYSTDTNAGINFVTKGSGAVKANGVPILTRSIQNITSAVTLGGNANTDYVAFIGSGGSVTLPTAVGNTSRYTVKNIDSASKTVSTTSSQTIDGATTYMLTRNASIDVVSDGTNWQVV